MTVCRRLDGCHAWEPLARRSERKRVTGSRGRPRPINNQPCRPSLKVLKITYPPISVHLGGYLSIAFVNIWPKASQNVLCSIILFFMATPLGTQTHKKAYFCVGFQNHGCFIQHTWYSDKPIFPHSSRKVLYLKIYYFEIAWALKIISSLYVLTGLNSTDKTSIWKEYFYQNC